MSTASIKDEYLPLSVKLVVEVSGETRIGSGFIYVTSNKSKFDYLFTAKHNLMIHPEDNKLYMDHISHIQLLDFNVDRRKFTLFQEIEKEHVRNRLIQFDSDLIILKIDKSSGDSRKRVLVSDVEINNCFAHSITRANIDTLVLLRLEVDSEKLKRFNLAKWDNANYLSGCSGSGILALDKPVLHGLIMLHPTEEFSGAYIDAVNISFSDINCKLKKLGLEQLVVYNESKKTRVVDDKIVVNLEEAPINGIHLNLVRANLRLRVDCEDDWFHDPLSFVDIRNSDFLFDYYHKYFLGERYKVGGAETFYLPKSSFTLRKAVLASYVDRLYYLALVDALGPSIEGSLLPVVYSSRYNSSSFGGIIISGVEQWKKLMYQVQANSKEYKFLIEIDILNFFDNVDTDLLCEKLLSVCKSENERRISDELKSVLAAFSNNSKSGLPQNNDASALLATFYLSELDSYMSHQVPVYLRFMDDIKIFCYDEFEARRYLNLLEMKLRDLKLSLNSQKTKIINLKPRNKKDKNVIIVDYQSVFSLERTKLAILSSSANFLNRNEAFHISTRIIIKEIGREDNGIGGNERSLRQAFGILKRSKIRGVSFNQHKADVDQIISRLPDLLIRCPWLTTDIVSFLIIIDPKLIKKKFWDEIVSIVTSEEYNIYPWQCYHLWFLLAKHKIEDQRLSRFASRYLDSNDDLRRPVIAALLIYMGSVDERYRRVILEKYKRKGFIVGHFQKRLALIALRNFQSEVVCSKNSVDLPVHKSLHDNKNKDLVFVNGEGDEDFSDLLQMYSL